MDEEPKAKRKKRSDTTGWCESTTDVRVSKMMKHKVAGDWRRFDIVKMKSTIAFIKWTEIATGKIVTSQTPVAVGMHGVLLEMENQQNRNFC